MKSGSERRCKPGCCFAKHGWRDESNATSILAPKNVCKQWQIELREKFNLNWPIYDGQKLTWYRSPARDHDFEKPVSREAWHQEPFVIMSSHLARRQDRQREILEGADPWDLVVLDEAHHARTKGAGTPRPKGRTGSCN